MSERVRCSGVTKAGKPCKGAPLSGSSYCKAHQGQMVVDIAAERKRLAALADSPERDKLREEVVTRLAAVGLGNVKQTKTAGGTATAEVDVPLDTQLAFLQALIDVQGWKPKEQPATDPTRRPSRVFYTPDDGRG